MKSNRSLWTCCVFLILISGHLVADEVTLGLESRVIESWDGAGSSNYPDTEDPINWQLIGSKFTAPDLPRSAFVMQEWPQALFGRNPENSESLGVFGIKGAFVRQGYNFIEIIPGVGEGDDFQAKPIPMPGKVHTVDFWVFGTNHNYYLEFHFRDYKGLSYVLSPFSKENGRDAGSVRFVGWRHMYIKMPSYLKRYSRYEPGVASLVLTKIVLATHPDEMVADFYIYLDNLKVVTDGQNSFYDGAHLTRPQKIQEIWGAEDEEEANQ